MYHRFQALLVPSLFFSVRVIFFWIDRQLPEVSGVSLVAKRTGARGPQEGEDEGDRVRE